MQLSQKPFNFSTEFVSAMQDLEKRVAEVVLTESQKKFAERLNANVRQVFLESQKKIFRLNQKKERRKFLPIDERRVQNEWRNAINKWADHLKKANKRLIKSDLRFRASLLDPVRRCCDVLCEHIVRESFRITGFRLQEIMNRSWSMSADVRQQITTGLRNIDESAYDFFYSEPARSRLPAKEFKQRCTAWVKEMELLVKDHRLFWGKLNGFVRAVLGLISLVLVIPALLVHLVSKEGYRKTFFPPALHKEFSGNIKKVFQYNEEPNARNDLLMD